MAYSSIYRLDKREIKTNITKICLFEHTENILPQKKKKKKKKNEIFQKKKKKKKIWYFFYISAPNIDCGYSLEPPRQGGSNEYPQSMFFSGNKKIIYTPVNTSFTI